MDVLEDLKDLDIELKEKKPFPKKFFITPLALFLIFIILSYFLTTPDIRDIITGLIKSSTVEGYTIDINSTSKLIFNKDAYTRLMEIYDENPDMEFKVCLEGDYKNGNYLIEGIYEPEMSLQSYSKVVAEPCPTKTLVSMHSHPYRHCLPSEQDIKSFELFKINNNNALMAVMCEKGRFNFYN